MNQQTGPILGVIATGPILGVIARGGATGPSPLSVIDPASPTWATDLFRSRPAATAIVFVPQLETVAEAHNVSLSPQDAPSLLASKQIGKVFDEFDSDSSAMIVLEGDEPLGADAHHYYDGLVKKLEADTAHVQHVQDFWGDPLTAAGSQSQDGKAALVQLYLAGNQGESLANESVDSVRRIVAIQHGEVILNAAASFQIAEAGVEHQLSMPDVPPPEDVEPPAPIPPEELAKLPIKAQRWLARKGPFEFRPVYPRNELKPAKRPPFQQIWFRLAGRAPDDDTLHRAMLAYASDFHLIGTATLPHGISYLQHNVQMASLDHAIWFHRPFRVDDWLLYACDSPSAQGARGLTRGMIYTRDGKLVASTAQEGMLRVLPDKTNP